MPGERPGGAIGSQIGNGWGGGSGGGGGPTDPPGSGGKAQGSGSSGGQQQGGYETIPGTNLTHEDVSNGVAATFFNLKHSAYNVVLSLFGSHYRATYVANGEGGYRTGFVKTNLTPVEDLKNLGLDVVSVASAGRGPGGGLLAKTGPMVGSVIQAARRLTSIVKQDARLLRLARETFEGNDLLRREANSLIKQLTQGNMSPGIGTKNIGKNIFEARSRGGARVYFRNNGDATEILGYSNKSNQQSVINLLLELY